MIRLKYRRAPTWGYRLSPLSPLVTVKSKFYCPSPEIEGVCPGSFPTFCKPRIFFPIGTYGLPLQTEPPSTVLYPQPILLSIFLPSQVDDEGYGVVPFPCLGSSRVDTSPVTYRLCFVENR